MRAFCVLCATAGVLMLALMLALGRNLGAAAAVLLALLGLGGSRWADDRGEIDTEDRERRW